MCEDKNHLDFSSENLSFPEIHLGDVDAENEEAEELAPEEGELISFKSDSLAVPEVLVNEDEKPKKDL